MDQTYWAGEKQILSEVRAVRPEFETRPKSRLEFGVFMINAGGCNSRTVECLTAVSLLFGRFKSYTGERSGKRPRQVVSSLMDGCNDVVASGVKYRGYRIPRESSPHACLYEVWPLLLRWMKCWTGPGLDRVLQSHVKHISLSSIKYTPP